MMKSKSIMLACGVLLGAAVAVLPSTATASTTMTYTGDGQVMVYDFNTAEGSLGSSGDLHDGMNFLAFASKPGYSPHVPDLLAMQEVNTTGNADRKQHTCAEFRDALEAELSSSGFHPNYTYKETRNSGGVCLVYRLRFEEVQMDVKESWTNTDCTVSKDCTNAPGKDCLSHLEYNSPDLTKAKLVPTPYDLLLKLRDNGATVGASPTYLDVAVVHLPWGAQNDDCARKNIPEITDEFKTTQFSGVNTRLILGDFNGINMDTNPAVFPTSSGYSVIPLADPSVATTEPLSHQICTYCNNYTRIDWAFVNSATRIDNEQLVPYGDASRITNDLRQYSDHKGMMFTLTE